MSMDAAKKGKRVQVHVPFQTLTERFDDLLGAGVNPEIYLDGEHLDFFDPQTLIEIKEAFRDKGLNITMHGPYLDLNPGSLDESTRRLTIEKYSLALEAASYLEPSTIVLHAGYDERRFGGNSALWLEQSMRTWPAFVKEAEKIGTVIAAEHIFEKTPHTLKALVESIGSPNFGVCIDTGHLNVFANRDTEGWLRELGPYIAEVHMHDNSGGHDEHLPIGDGLINFRLFLMLLRRYAKDPVYTIEPHGEDNIWRAIKTVRELLDS